VKKFVKTLLLSLVLLCIAVQAQALDREVQIDILTNKITTLLKAGKNAEALPYFAELEGMQAALPESFDYFYIDTLDKSGKAEKALERSEGYLKKYGKKGKYYGQVIEIMSRRSMEAEANAIEAKAKPNGEKCMAIGGAECASGYCLPAPHSKVAGAGFGYCTAAYMNCALAGSDGAMYGATLTIDGELLTCMNPMQTGKWAQFFRR